MPAPKPDCESSSWRSGHRAPPCAAVPDFLTPPPVSSRPRFDEDLRRVRATPPEQIRRDLRVTYEDALPPGLESLYRRPGSGIDRLVRLVGAYWERALADHWPRLRLVLEGDVVYRTRALAAGGAMAVFEDLHERVGERRRPDRLAGGNG